MEKDTIQQLENTLSVLMDSHRMDLIGEQAHKILVLNPEHRYATGCLLFSLINRHMYEELYEAGKNALKLFPNEAWVHDMMYYYYLHKGGSDYLNAKKHMEEAIKLSPESAVYYRNLAEIYLINREPEKALKHLETAVKLNPDNAEYKSRLGLSLIRSGKVNEALKIVNKALKDDPDHKDVLDTAGMVYLLSGELDKGEELFRDALSRFPTYEYFQKHLDWVEREKHDRDSRIKQYKKYTPLYLRQKDRKRFFDEDSKVDIHKAEG
ncbi:hypothetical protein A3F07_01920 [candidate division WWE3 bacterium RIFCSPHIGHO2_12_FULL_38_15]|uniref:Uncharacterized protein n=1 Tax=candidate division WWE3 bacterium RIFCSPHIGHO2_02_FULL_38_14 TaxID=1802620 RepID=A0A1F4V8C3_UNCKA|nr:MAG: hypothetical protein A2793_03155 [candidate division WWE3 bacterium RIFCSPHIGHO2_01_FULL_38_45]OGC48638.1 MAG: hypothetical protein A3F07_01920 [candidate division WWE3 bacterium RIFCSPHIGHO2_12_FULL_38_15]OGC53044.1 MAG: hypothetical protein A3B64_01180 [candidate division WWE3 bacterium RIFCSPLOWO2_01_FULL_37_24]OGC53407.1 MAG: hypothetical protein A3D91_00035 [candidate division WWE3 bacterium RIFCSPHIGHO2_02_FULL_38_14]HLB51881.1 tetratricopeptide repeat protein [Patescibacteria gro